MGVSTALAVALRALRPVEAGPSLVNGDPSACARALGVDGIAVSLVTAEGPGELVWASPGPSTRLEDLQFTLGQGPGPEVIRTRSALILEDLTLLPADRWPVLLPEIVALDIGAVFCLPLAVGDVCVGTMTLQRRRVGPLSSQGDARILAGALTSVVTDDGASREAFARAEPSSGLYRASVHQATGMMSVQSGVPPSEALVLLRAYAVGNGRTVVEVAEDVLARRVHFRNDGAEPESSGGEGS